MFLDYKWLGLQLDFKEKSYEEANNPLVSLCLYPPSGEPKPPPSAEMIASALKANKPDVRNPLLHPPVLILSFSFPHQLPLFAAVPAFVFTPRTKLPSSSARPATRFDTAPPSARKRTGQRTGSPARRKKAPRARARHQPPLLLRRSRLERGRRLTERLE